MHSIKYKSWHKAKKKVSKVLSLPNGSKNGTIILPFTSLKDRKGKEIYEYDIVKISKDLGSVKAGYYIVTHHQGCFKITKDQHLNYMDHYLWFVADNCEVMMSFLEYKDNWMKLQIKSDLSRSSKFSL
ncbi:MAG: YopX family protein [Candidatus Roizmanbacteria bacterium]